MWSHQSCNVLAIVLVEASGMSCSCTELFYSQHRNFNTRCLLAADFCRFFNFLSTVVGVWWKGALSNVLTVKCKWNTRRPTVNITKVHWLQNPSHTKCYQALQVLCMQCSVHAHARSCLGRLNLHCKNVNVQPCSSFYPYRLPSGRSLRPVKNKEKFCWAWK